jgi:hypothetical protein
VLKRVALAKAVVIARQGRGIKALYDLVKFRFNAGKVLWCHL